MGVAALSCQVGVHRGRVIAPQSLHDSRVPRVPVHPPGVLMSRGILAVFRLRLAVVPVFCISCFMLVALEPLAEVHSVVGVTATLGVRN
jgi:hypothetical protein